MTLLLTTVEAAERLHMSERSLREIKRRGLIRYVAVTERKIAFRPEDCDEYVAARLRMEQPCDTKAKGKPSRRSAGRSGKIIPFSAMVG